MNLQDGRLFVRLPSVSELLTYSAYKFLSEDQAIQVTLSSPSGSITRLLPPGLDATSTAQMIVPNGASAV